MAEERQEVSAQFPIAGLDVTCEFGRQPGDTTPDNQNVRSREVIEERIRGGSRAGLTKYVPEVVSRPPSSGGGGDGGGGDTGSATYGPDQGSLIQYLGVLVDPQQPAIRQMNNLEFPDPSTNNLRPRVPSGRLLRRGGPGTATDDTGYLGDAGPYQLVQAFTHAATGNVEIPFATHVGNLVLVFVAGDGNLYFDPLVTTDSGLPFTKIGGQQRQRSVTATGGIGSYRMLSLWYRIAGSGETGIRMEGPSNSFNGINAIEFSGNPPGPLDGNSGISDSGDPASIHVFVGGQGELIVASFFNNTIADLDSLAAAAGYSLITFTAFASRDPDTFATVRTGYAGTCVFSPAGMSSEAVPGLSWTSSAPNDASKYDDYLAIAASFRGP